VVAGLADWLCRLLARADCNVAAPPMPANWALAWYLAFAGIGWIGRRQYIRIGAPTVRRWVNWGLVAMLAVSVPHQFARPLEITFLDVGQGDCILIRTPFRQHILVDGGGDSVYWQERGRNVGMTTVVPYLRHRGVRHIDLVISSHPHEDHLHGLLAVLEHFSVGMIIDSGQTHTSPTYRKYLELIMEKRIPYQRLRAGDQVLLRGGVSLSILHPHQFLSGTGSDLNNNSLVIRLAYQGRSVLLTGDIDREGLEDLLKRGGLTPVDLVKVPHHGSRAALVPEFYQVVQPRHAVISVGRNSFGHPHPDVLGFLELSGITALRTDQEGAVSFYIWNGLFGRYSQAR
jgi:competence protein ComEC